MIELFHWHWHSVYMVSVWTDIEKCLEVMYTFKLLVMAYKNSVAVWPKKNGRIWTVYCKYILLAGLNGISGLYVVYVQFICLPDWLCIHPSISPSIHSSVFLFSYYSLLSVKSVITEINIIKNLLLVLLIVNLILLYYKFRLHAHVDIVYTFQKLTFS